MFTLPFLGVGLILNILYPDVFSVGGPSALVQWIAIVILAVGIINWMWSALLILIKVPRGELITTGPYAIVKHPLYTGMAFLVLPWLGVLCNSWLGFVIGAIVYVGCRFYAPREEERLAKMFGSMWDYYCHTVKIPWL